MDDLRDTGWWSDFLTRVEHEHLSALADEFGAAPSDLESALAALDDGEAITETPAWPEIVRRVRTGASLRDTARRFGTSPRRIRRGLARSAIRVRGTNLGEAGAPQLAEYSEELGKVPDGAIAEKAGVTVEAVQGERRRQGIEAFRPSAGPRRRRARPEPEPRVPAKRAKPQKVWQREEVATQVVHRPGRRKVEAVQRAAPAMASFAKGLQLPGLRASAESKEASASRRGGRSESSRRAGLRRRVVVRSDSDPIADAIQANRTETAPRTKGGASPAARPSTRTRRRRTVSRPSVDSSSDGDPSRAPTTVPTPSSRPSSSSLRSPSAEPSGAAPAAAAPETRRARSGRALRTVSVPTIPGAPSVVAAGARRRRQAPSSAPLNRPSSPPAGRPERDAGPGPVVVSSAQLRRIGEGRRVLRDDRLTAVPGGFTGPGVPEIWRVAVGADPLPLVVLAYSMVDAISLVSRCLESKQLRKLSVWSDGPLS